MGKTVNMDMMSDGGMSCCTSTSASTEGSAIKTADHRRSSSFCRKKSLPGKSISTRSPKSSLYSTSKCNDSEMSSETIKLQIKEAMNKLGRKASRSEGKKKKKKKQSSEDSNSNSWERMISELEQEKVARAKMSSEAITLRIEVGKTVRKSRGYRREKYCQ